jgi:hypothetical protein
MSLILPLDNIYHTSKNKYYFYQIKYIQQINFEFNEKLSQCSIFIQINENLCKQHIFSIKIENIKKLKILIAEVLASRNTNKVFDIEEIINN